MSKKISMVLFCMVLMMSLSFVSCGSKEKKPDPPGSNFQAELAGAPDWVVKGCFAYWGNKADDKLCGVGSMGGTRNVSLARKTAVARGRTDIARTLQVRVKSMIKDYQATVTGGEGFGQEAADEQYVADVSKQITDMTLAGTEMVEIWISPNGTFYALVALDSEKFKDAISKAQQLDEKVRQYVEKNAEKAFNELDKELEQKKAE